MGNKFVYQGREFVDREIVGASITKAQSLDLLELSVDAADITLKPKLNRDFYTHEPYPMFTRERLRFKSAETNPLSKEYQQNTPIYQYIDNNPVWVWYLQSLNMAGKGSYKLKAFSALGRLMQKTNYGGIYSRVVAADAIACLLGAPAFSKNKSYAAWDYVSRSNKIWRCTTAHSGTWDANHFMAVGVVDVSNKEPVPFVIEAPFNDERVKISGHLPIASARDNLQQILLAICANLQTDSNGVLHVKSLSKDIVPSMVTNPVGKADVYSSNASAKSDTPVTDVVVVGHSFTVKNETKELFNGDAVGTQTIAFTEPMTNITASGLTLIYPTSTNQGTNYAIVSGTGTLTGKPYNHTTWEVSRNLIPNAEVRNVVRVENATLIDIYSAEEIADMLQAYYVQRNKIKVAVAQNGNTERNILNVGDVINVIDPYDEDYKTACIESSQTNISATNKIEISAVVDFAPWQKRITDQKRVLLAPRAGEEKEWVVPEGVTSITVALISGGSGGRSGDSGSNGTAHTIDKSAGGALTLSCPAGAGGAGGSAGTGGSGGRVRVVANIAVTAGDVFEYRCGAGGINGGIGGDTSFGSYSTSGASVISGGYTDPVSGDVYASAGSDGIAGDAGGAGGTATTTDASNGANGGGSAGGVGGTAHKHPESTQGAWDEYTLYMGGGGGGGASAGSSGNSGTDAMGLFHIDWWQVLYEHGTYTDYFWSVFQQCTFDQRNDGHNRYPLTRVGGDGGNGANGAPATPVSSVAYGCGGNGGNGGGGGGGTGAANFSQPYNYYFRESYDENKTDIYVPVAGRGGQGSAGGAGCQGCVIIYYTQIVPQE